MVSGAGRNKRQLTIVFAFTSVYLVVEVIGGIVTGSLALLADAAHMLTDVGGLGLALFAIRFAERPFSSQSSSSMGPTWCSPDTSTSTSG